MIERHLSQLENAQLIRRLFDEEAAYIFKHALTQDTAYEMLLKNRRRDIHRRVAEVYERLYADQLDEFAAILSDHCWFGERWEDAAKYALCAGARALRIFAMREAMTHFERALEALKRLSSPSPIQEYDALMGWAKAAFGYRPYAEQLEHLLRAEKIARELNNNARLAHTLYEIGQVNFAQGYNLRAVEPLVECFQLADALSDERYKVTPTFVMGMTTLDANPRGAISYFERAIELAQRYEDADIEALAWSAQAMAQAMIGKFDQAHAAMQHSQALLAQVQSPKTPSDVFLFSAWAFFHMGDAQKGIDYSQRSVELALATENKDCLCGSFACVGLNRLASQQLPQAADAFREAIRRSQFSGAKPFENWGQAGLALAELQSGHAEALYDLEKAYQDALAWGIRMNSAVIALFLGNIYAARGDLGRAEIYLTQAIEHFRPNQMIPYLVRALETLTQIYDRQGKTVQAKQTRMETERLTQELMQGTS
jgi:tetratricopeptide (TPR) repeat protein